MADLRQDATQIRPGVGAGTRLNGIYEIERLIAVGGMGEIYRGRAIQTGDAVAIKTIRPELAQNDAALALFRKEAAALHNLYHEAIVRYYVFSVDPAVGSPYLAMEFVDGQALSDILKQRPLDYDAVRILQRRLAGGLQAAHDLGIVHRDVSPDNVILPAGNVARAKIIDFGIARSTVLGEGTVIGTGFAGKYAYVSPEQLGLFGGDVTPKSDIYSLGLVLAESLLGRALDMGGNQAQVVEKRRKVPDLSGVDARLRPLIERMLQPNPNDRIATMAEVAAWQPVERTAAATVRRRAPLALAGLAMLAVLGGGAALVVPRILGAGTTNPQGDRRDSPNVLPDPGDPSATGPTGPTVVNTDPTPAGPNVARTDPPPAGPNVVPTEPPKGPEVAVNVPPTQSLIEPVARYIRDYEGGDCFFLNPLSVSSRSTSIEAFGASPGPFAAFDEAFRKRNGFEAQINLRLVNETQCPAIAFLKKIGLDPDRAPKLQLDSYSIRDTESLKGTVDKPPGRHVDVLLVSDDGYAYSLANYTKVEGDVAKFTVRVGRTGSGRAKPQLVIAISSPQPLALLGSGKPIAADALFPLIVDEARAQGMTLDVAVKYFKLEG